MTSEARIDVDKPLWDIKTFWGRFKYFAWMTDFRTITESNARLEEAKTLVDQYRLGREPAGTKKEEVIYAMKLYKSAFHPDSGELQNFAGRMSFQVPGGMLITGGMLTFYKSTQAIVLWQFINQSFNAIVNYTNRNANSPTTVTQLGVSYVSAISAALVAALGFKNFCLKRTSSPIIQRFIPFTAVAAANCANIPLMRQNEIINGVDVLDENGKVVGKSRTAAIKGISQVTLSRIVMASPGMLLLPFIMERFERVQWFRRATYVHAPFQTAVVGVFLTFMVPAACSIYPQTCKIKTSTIKLFEPEFYKQIVTNTKGKLPDKVYFNKGL